MPLTIARGFTLIELLIALSIFAFLIMIAGPQYANFMGNMQIRNGAENTLTGVRIAQVEAIKGNTLTKFVLNPTSCTGGWQVSRRDEDDPSTYDSVQSYTFSDGACKTTVTPDPSGATTVTFDGLGRIAPNDDGSQTLHRIDVTNSNVSDGSARPLRVVITPKSTTNPTGIKLCDPAPAVASDDPRVCPAES